MVEWDTLPEDIGLADGGRSWVVSFGWLYNVAELGYFDLWGVPRFLRTGHYSQEAVRAERRRLNGLAWVHGSRVVVGFEGVYVSQLFGTHPCDFNGQEYLKEAAMMQMGVILRSRPMVCIRFFWHMGAHNFRLAGRWLYYGFYWMLVLCSWGLLRTGNSPGHRFGAL